MTSIRESSFIDIAGFPGTTRVFKTQAPPGAPKRRTAPGAAVVSSVVATTPAQYPGPGTPPLRMRYTAANLWRATPTRYPVCVAYKGDSPVEYWSEDDPEEPEPFDLAEVNRNLSALGEADE